MADLLALVGEVVTMPAKEIDLGVGLI